MGRSGCQSRQLTDLSFESNRMNRIFLIAMIGLTTQGLSAEEIDYSRQIRPLLSNSCYACHGPDRSNQENELRLDFRKHAIETAIIPGDADSSELIRRLTSSDDTEQMPPPESNRPGLNADQIALVREWINQGAKFTSHWSYDKPERPELPTVSANAWPINALDHFVLAQNESRSVPPSKDADPRTLIRRVYFDLTGLPPTTDVVSQYQSNASQETYHQIVDNLLSSKRFGERMAAFWLDLVRFADTCGYHGDQHREISAYRSFVIDAFNSNLPFDKFTIAQIAGDLLPNPTIQDRIASGYNRLLQTTQEGGAQAKEYRAIYAADRVRNASTVWLGTTLGCAQCHDHKFDPFSAEDFYRFAAFFADVQEIAVGAQPANLTLPTEEESDTLKKFDTEITELKSKLADSEAASPETTNSDQDSDSKSEIDDLKNKLKQLEDQRKQANGKIKKTLTTTSVERRMTRILPRGNWLDESGPEVAPEIPAIFGSLNEAESASRLELARWIVSPDNPLTARVYANHLWRLMFGEGLVRSPDDFGSQGNYPTHPQLLDWLACELIDSGWNTKHILKLMVTSRTYQQSSESNQELQQRDLENQWLARQNRFRLDAEMIRDGALAVSGLLVTSKTGGSAKPYQPAGYWAELNFPKRKYVADQGDNQYRRGVFTYWCRTFLHPSLAAFDAPTREECTAQRTRSNNPLQALVLLNDPTYVEAATQLAHRVLAETNSDSQNRIPWIFNEVLARNPTSKEADILASVYDEQLKRYSKDTESAKQIAQTLGADQPDNLAELAAWTAVCRVILNLHETITRY